MSDPNTNPAPATPTPGPQGQTHDDNTKLMAILSYIGPLVFIPLLVESKKNPSVKFHVKQGLLLFIIEVILYAISGMLFFLWFLYPLVSIAVFILSIIGILHAVNNEQKQLPIIGQYADQFLKF
jgi:uncharacterized membrane protein